MHGTIARWKALDERAVELTGANCVQNVLVLVVVLVRVHELKAVCHHVRTVGVHLRADCGHLQQPQRVRANAGAVRATPKHVVAVRREAVRVAQDGKDLAGEPRLRVRHRLAQRVQEFRRVPQGLDHLHRSGGVDNGENKFERAHGGVGVVWHAGGCADMI